MKTKKSELELYSFSSKKMKTRGWSTKFASGLNIIIGLVQKVTKMKTLKTSLLLWQQRGADQREFTHFQAFFA